MARLALPERIEKRIHLIRGVRVMLDADLADLYGVETRVLNQAVKRNHERFPESFMFRLSRAEVEDLNLSQTVIGSQKHRDPRLTPFAFTEHGAIMLASVLNSPVAVRASIHVVQAFVRVRRFALSHSDLARKLERLERHYETHDRQFKVVFEAIRRLMAPPPEPEKKGRIGFGVRE